MTNSETWLFMERRQRKGAVSPPRIEHAEKRKGISEKTYICGQRKLGGAVYVVHTEDLPRYVVRTRFAARGQHNRFFPPTDLPHRRGGRNATNDFPPRFPQNTRTTASGQTAPLDPDRKRPEKHTPAPQPLAAGTNQSNQAPTPPETPRENSHQQRKRRVESSRSGLRSLRREPGRRDEPERGVRRSGSRSRVPCRVPSPATPREEGGAGGRERRRRVWCEEGWILGGAKPKRWDGGRKMRKGDRAGGDTGCSLLFIVRSTARVDLSVPLNPRSV
jgi:hypothetical protein